MILRTHKDKNKQYTPRKLARLFTHHSKWLVSKHVEHGAAVVRFERDKAVKVFVIR